MNILAPLVTFVFWVFFITVSHASDSSSTLLANDSNEEMLNMDIQIRPLDIKMTDDERNLPQNLVFTDVNEESTPQLLCSDEKLKHQVKEYIYKKINERVSNSVIENRERIIMVNNMNDFEEITEEDINKKKEFNTAAVLAYLRINEKRTINKICRSYGNSSSLLQNIDLIIYPYLNYYKVVVANFVFDPKKTSDSTFIYNW